MNFTDVIDADIKKALLAKDQAALRGLRAIKSALLLARTEKGGSGSPDEEAEIKMLQKQIKQRKESAAIYVQQNRPDLAAIEEEEIAVIERYLPVQLSAADVEKELQQLMESQQIAGPKELGRLMGLATKHFAGRAEGKVISDAARKLLGQADKL